MRESREASRIDGAEFAVMLGSGLGGVTEGFTTERITPFEDIPGLSPPDVAGHAGAIHLCRVGRERCLFVSGRKHHYEDKADEIAVLIRFLHSVGVRKLLVTSAAGSLVSRLEPGELVLVEQVLDRQWRRPIPCSGTGPSRPGAVGQRLELDGPLTRLVKQAATAAGIALVRGTLYSGPGPVYETRADVYALQLAGASVASMSAAPELANAQGFGIQVACVAVVTNWVTGMSSGPLLHEHVLEASRGATASLQGLIGRLMAAKTTRSV